EIAFRRYRSERIDEPLAEARVIGGHRQRSLTVGRFGTLGRVIDQNQVQIGGHRHLTAAELAEAQHDHAPARHGPVTPGEFGGGVWQEPGDGCFGNVGEGAAGRLSVKPAAEKLYADLEFAVTDPASRKIEHVLVVARTVKQP